MSNYYHIIQHAIGDDLLFYDEGNYRYFMEKMMKFLGPYPCLMAYCLMSNHLHLLLKLEETDDHFKPLSNLFNSYAKSYNKLYNRRGSLFIRSYKRIPLFYRHDIKRTIMYIHRNPIHHGMVKFYHVHEYSSYSAILGNETPGMLLKDEVLNLFGSTSDFISEHETYKGIF